MTTRTPETAPRPAADADLTPRYILVLIVEAAVIAALYWLGRHFG